MMETVILKAIIECATRMQNEETTKNRMHHAEAKSGQGEFVNASS